MSYLGDFRLGDTFDTDFTTASYGVPTPLSGSPVISAYVGNSTTELTAGITLTVDFDSRTGMNHVRVVASSGNGYATASNYQLVITTGTVAGSSVVGYVVKEFSIENRSALMPATAGRTLVVDASGLADATMVKAGASGAGNTITTSGGVTLPAATLASTTNITAGTITTATNLTNAATAGDFTATMKTSIGTSVAASAVASVTGNVGGNVTGSVGSVVGAVGSVTGAVGSVTAPVGITSNIKKNQALAAFEFLMTDSTNHNPATGLTVGVTRSIDGGAFAAGTLSSVSEIGNGIYSVDFAAGDLNGKVVMLKATSATADITYERVVTQP